MTLCEICKKKVNLVDAARLQLTGTGIDIDLCQSCSKIVVDFLKELQERSK